ncbi:MAG: hypothetical protein DRH93_12725 [Deltaproteobacteria bacterium]|nr:MAG: hypothetical protein DRH93_12725 [Deltaproteobacteria bacterium]
MIRSMKRPLITTFSALLLFACGTNSPAYATDQCMECHEEMAADHAVSVHTEIGCLECHAQAEKEDHEQLVFSPVDCRQCHALHDEKILHDAHTRVSCNACHIKGGIPGRNPESGNIIFSGTFASGMALPSHQAIASGRDHQCENCHFKGNAVGAASMVLPPKSILCMPCHVATFSMSDKTTLVSLFIFILGMAGLCMVWFSGSLNTQAYPPIKKRKRNLRLKPGPLFSDKFFQLLKIVFLEVIFLQRFFKLSRVRWMIHALIFFPFLFRFFFGLTALLLSIFLPDGFITSAMLDKNHALRALFFDVTGLMILTGSLLFIVRKKKETNETITSLPEPGPGMPMMIGLIVGVGFILEGLRIAMTGWVDGAGWAPLGYGISLLFKGMTGLTDIYGYVWYVHAILTGVFIALVPFTRMAHIITAPLVLILNARARKKENFQK